MPTRTDPASPGLFSQSSAHAPGATTRTQSDVMAGTRTSSAAFSSHGAAAWITAHCDGGARGNPGPAGYGALVTSADGTVLAELSEFLGQRTNNFAEYSGLLGSLAYALEHNHRRLRVVSDSELMVKQIQGKYQVKSPDLKPLYEEAKRRIARLEGFEITHALRHKNKDADRLANDAMDRGMSGRGSAVQRPGERAGAKAETRGSASIPAPATRPIPIARPDRPAPPHAAAERTSNGGLGDTATSAARSAAPTMLRGFTRDGVVHVLGGGTKLPDGLFVKIIPE